jgi:hypothetical protein
MKKEDVQLRLNCTLVCVFMDSDFGMTNPQPLFVVWRVPDLFHLLFSLGGWVGAGDRLGFVTLQTLLYRATVVVDSWRNTPIRERCWI